MQKLSRIWPKSWASPPLLKVAAGRRRRDTVRFFFLKPPRTQFLEINSHPHETRQGKQLKVRTSSRNHQHWEKREEEKTTSTKFFSWALGVDIGTSSICPRYFCVATNRSSWLMLMRVSLFWNYLFESAGQNQLCSVCELNVNPGASFDVFKLYEWVLKSTFNESCDFKFLFVWLGVEKCQLS